MLESDTIYLLNTEMTR